MKSGTIDAITIDHCPYTYEEKTVAFSESPPGTVGFRVALSLLWQRFVMTQDWTALELWNALSSRPAQCLGQVPASVTPHQTAELVLFSPHLSWRVDRCSLGSQAYNTPLLGQQLHGRVQQVWCPQNTGVPVS